MPLGIPRVCMVRTQISTHPTSGSFRRGPLRNGLAKKVRLSSSDIIYLTYIFPLKLTNMRVAIFLLLGFLSLAQSR